MLFVAPILAALITTAPPPAGMDVESAVVAPAARDPGLRIDEPAPLSILDWNDPEERRAHGLGEGAARRPVEAFETALCELAADPRLQAGLLLPTPASDIDPAEPVSPAISLSASGCDSGVPARRGSAFARPGLGSGNISPEQWSVIGGVTVTAPGPVDPNPTTSDHAVAPSAWGELSSHPGQIQQPPLRLHERSDKVKYQVMRDTTLGFDGHLIRVRMTYPKLDNH